MRSAFLAACLVALLVLAAPSRAETPDEWIRLGARVHGGFGSFIPLGIRVGEADLRRLGAPPRGVTVGQRTPTVAPERAPAGAAAVILVRGRTGGAALRYVVPDGALARLAAWNRDLDERGRFDAVMAADGLFTTEPETP